MGGDLPKGGESKNNSVDTLKIENTPMGTKETIAAQPTIPWDQPLMNFMLQ